MISAGSGGFLGSGYDMFYPQAVQPLPGFTSQVSSHTIPDPTDTTPNSIYSTSPACNTYNNVGGFFPTPQGFINPYFKNAYTGGNDTSGYSHHPYNYAINRSESKDNLVVDMFSNYSTTANGRLSKGDTYQDLCKVEENHKNDVQYHMEQKCFTGGGGNQVSSCAAGLASSHQQESPGGYLGVQNTAGGGGVTSHGEPVNLSGWYF